MVETFLKWFKRLERIHVYYVVKRVNGVKGSQITRDRRRLKILRKTTTKDLNINELDKNMVYDRTLCNCLIHAANSSY